MQKKRVAGNFHRKHEFSGIPVISRNGEINRLSLFIPLPFISDPSMELHIRRQRTDCALCLRLLDID